MLAALAWDLKLGKYFDRFRHNLICSKAFNYEIVGISFRVINKFKFELLVDQQLDSVVNLVEHLQKAGDLCHLQKLHQ